MEWPDVARGNVVRASTSIPLGVGSATRWSGCWKRTTIGGSHGRRALSPWPVGNNRCRPFRVGRVNARCRLQRPSHPQQQPLQAQSLQRLRIGLRTTYFRFTAGSAIQFSALLHKGSRRISHLPPGGVCPARVVAEPDISSRNWVNPKGAPPFRELLVYAVDQLAWHVFSHLICCGCNGRGARLHGFQQLTPLINLTTEAHGLMPLGFQ